MDSSSFARKVSTGATIGWRPTTTTEEDNIESETATMRSSLSDLPKISSFIEETRYENAISVRISVFFCLTASRERKLKESEWKE